MDRVGVAHTRSSLAKSHERPTRARGLQQRPSPIGEQDINAMRLQLECLAAGVHHGVTLAALEHLSKDSQSVAVESFIKVQIGRRVGENILPSQQQFLTPRNQEISQVRRLERPQDPKMRNATILHASSDR